MKKIILFCSISIALFSCKGEDPIIDLSHLCDSEELWLINKKDTFHLNHSRDSFVFHQAGGYHGFYFENSDVNKLTIKVLTKPEIGETIVYKKIFVREISGIYISDNFYYDNSQDSVLTISNQGTHYLVKINPIQSTTSSSKSIELRACSLKMNDINP